MKMEFGKHKGREVATLPSSYLRWLGGLPHLEPDLRAEVEQELVSRARAAQRFRDCCELLDGQARVQIAAQDADLFASLIDAGYRHLSGQVDPDTADRLDLLVENLRRALEAQAQLEGARDGS